MRTPLDLGLQIWKAGWVHALAGSNPASSAGLTLVTDNGGPFRSFRFAAFIATHPELRHVRTGVNKPGQNGVGSGRSSR